VFLLCLVLGRVRLRDALSLVRDEYRPLVAGATMSKHEIILWCRAVNRAWREARSQESRIFFAEWSFDFSLEYITRVYNRIERMMGR